jgi:hypothetical protein
MESGAGPNTCTLLEREKALSGAARAMTYPLLEGALLINMASR